PRRPVAARAPDSPRRPGRSPRRRSAPTPARAQPPRAPCLPAEAGGRSTDLAPQPSPAVPPGGVGLLRIDERLARRSCRWVGGQCFPAFHHPAEPPAPRSEERRGGTKRKL